MPVVLLVRHGQASFGADDYDVLSDVGRRQCELVGGELRRRGLRSPVVVAGGLRRQQDSAALALPDAEVRVDPRWDEYDHLDLVRRYPPADPDTPVQDVLDAALAAWLADPDGGWAAFRDPARTALTDLAAGLEGRDAVVLTSGGVLAAVCSALLGVGDGAVVALQRVTVNAAITKVVVGRSGSSLVTFNDSAHLEGAGRELLTYR